MQDLSPHCLADAVSGVRLMADLGEIARWVKLSGTAEELEALRFVEGRLRDAGYVTTLLAHDAYISLPGAAEVLVDGAPQRCITHSFGRSGEVAGVPVYLGQGDTADFAGRDVAGRIVVLEGMATPALAQRASRAGAAGQLHISHHEHLHEMCISPVWGSPSPETIEHLPRTIACTVPDAAGGALRDALCAGGSPVVTLRARVDTGWRKTPLLVAELPAPEAPDGPFVLLSGHHDSWYFGVMDNGSANAGMLEVARVCAVRRSAWRRGLRLCFWSGHSHGRYSGSTWYADTFRDELDARCVAHVNVDSLGGVGATELGHAAAMAELTHLAAAAVAAEGGAGHLGKRKSRNSDESFGGIGIPSLFGAISEQRQSHARARNALGWWWHTPHDLLDKVDEAFLVRDTRVLTRAVWRLLGDALLPLDHAATARSLLDELAPLAATLHATLPLADLVAATEALRDIAASLQRRGASAGAPGLAAANAALVRVSRALVPVDYHDGDRYAHPPALPLPDWAVLQPIRALAAATPDSNEARLRMVSARRARNRLAAALRAARQALDEAAAALAA